MSPSAPRDGKKSPSPVNAEPPAASDQRGLIAAPEDEDLVTRVQAGDRQAFRELFDKYHRRVFALALQVVKNPHDASEVVQETFMRVFRYIPGFRFESTFRSWMFRIGTNVAIDRVRRANKEPLQMFEYDDGIDSRDSDVGVAAYDIGSAYLGGDPGKLNSRKELQEKLQAALSQISPMHRQILLLRDVDDLSYEEMAVVLEIKKGTVMSRLFHARRYLKLALGSYLDDDPDLAAREAREAAEQDEDEEDAGGQDDAAR